MIRIIFLVKEKLSRSTTNSNAPDHKMYENGCVLYKEIVIHF